jgi:hypothetical protein
MQRLLPVLSLLASCAAVLVVLTRSPPLPPAAAQAGGEQQGRFIMATAVYQNGTRSIAYVLDVQGERLACYSADGNGIEYRGTRDITCDLKPQELNPGPRRFSVEDVCKATQQATTPQPPKGP